MSMKKSANSKIFFTITLFFVVSCFLATSSWAAKKVDISKGNANNFIRQLNENNRPVSTSMKSVFGMSDDGGFTLTRQRTDFNGITHERYQQTFAGIPVWGMQVIVSKGQDNNVTKLRGNIVLESKADIKNIPNKLDPVSALKEMQDAYKEKDPGANWYFSNEKYGTYVYFRKNGKAVLCYVVSFFADTDCGNPSQPVFFIDVKNGKVLESYDWLRYADGVGPGGNEKIGYYYYGTDYSPFCVTASSGTCTMNCTDVKTVDLNHGTSGSTAYSYTCYENTHEEINGGYCPLNDAQFFGQVVYDMYLDWYSTSVLPFQLTMKVHYSTNYENAFWDGSSMTFGDGYTTFHPLVCLDVSAHEVSHGFTEYNSDLTYSGQSGGINEAFSDMAGEASEYYSRGSCDYMCGYDIYKAAGQALRYLYDPPLDGISIDHVDDYYSGMDVHYSSGIFNKVFYLIAVSPGWTTRMSFDIFTKANMDYWTASTTFQQGAEGALDAAADYGYNCADVVAAFAEVGITLTCPEPPVADFEASPTSGGYPLTVSFTDLSTNSPTSWAWTFAGGTPGTSTSQNPSVVYNTAGTYTVTLTATNVAGSDTETKTDYITVTDEPLEYCDSQGNNYNYEYIANVTVDSFSNSSAGSNYTDYTYLTAYLTAGDTVSVSLTPEFPSSTYTEYWKIWIDYNLDGDFTDSGEEVFSGVGSSTVTGSFTVESVNVTTRMRVSMKWNAAPSSCETFSYGEVEDYTVSISSGSTVSATSDSARKH